MGDGEKFDFSAHMIDLTRSSIPLCAVCGDPAPSCDCYSNLLWREDATADRADTMVAPDEPWHAYTDGSGTVAGKACGCGVVIVRKGIVVAEASVAVSRGTNNFAEVSAIGIALRLLVAICESLSSGRSVQALRAIVHSDSQWALEASSPVTTWRLKTKEKDGSPKRSTIAALAAQELRRQFTRVSYEWIAGHSGHQYNERADELAGLARRRMIQIQAKKAEEAT